MDDGDGPPISTSVGKKKLGPNLADYAGLTLGFAVSLLQGTCDSSENGIRNSLNKDSRKN
jgi:hypothetical protein